MAELENVVYYRASATGVPQRLEVIDVTGKSTTTLTTLNYRMGSALANVWREIIGNSVLPFPETGVFPYYDMYSGNYSSTDPTDQSFGILTLDDLAGAYNWYTNKHNSICDYFAEANILEILRVHDRIEVGNVVDGVFEPKYDIAVTIISDNLVAGCEYTMMSEGVNTTQYDIDSEVIGFRGTIRVYVHNTTNSIGSIGGNFITNPHLMNERLYRICRDHYNGDNGCNGTLYFAGTTNKATQNYSYTSVGFTYGLSPNNICTLTVLGEQYGDITSTNRMVYGFHQREYIDLVGIEGSIRCEAQRRCVETTNLHIQKEEEIIVIDRDSPRLSVKGSEIYMCDDNDIINVLYNLSNDTVSKTIYSKIHGLSDPADAIISLRFYYGMREYFEEHKATQTKQTILVGDTPMSSGSITGMVNASGYLLDDEMITIQFGPIDVDALNNDFTDYEPYTSVQMFVPFKGYIRLDPTKVIGHKIGLRMTVNIYTGDTLIEVTSDDARLKKKVLIDGVIEEIDGNIYIDSTNVGYNIPINYKQAYADSTKMLINGLSAVIGGAGGALAGGAVGNIPGAVAGALGGAISGLNNANQMISKPIHNMSGSMSGDSNVMMDLYPYLIIVTPVEMKSAKYEELIGKPGSGEVTVGSCEGFLQLNVVSPTSLNKACEHNDKIVELLKRGIFIENVDN